MPLVKITISNKDLLDTAKILREISKIVGEESGKGEGSLMVCISDGTFMMRAEEADSAFIDFRGIGKINKEINSAISLRISELLKNEANIPAENIYLNFIDMPRENWGHSKGVY